MNTKISQITSSALTVIAVAGTLMGMVGQGPLDGNLMNIFYAFAALSILEIILQDYRIFPHNPAVNVPSTRKFYHQAETIADKDCGAASLLFAPGLPKSEVHLVSGNPSCRKVCEPELVGAA